jgi:hypothetical protein
MEESKWQKLIEQLFLFIACLSLLNSITRIDFNLAFGLYGYMIILENVSLYEKYYI